MTLIDNWRQGLRMFSVQAQAASLAVLGTWGVIPDDLKTSLPGWTPKAIVAVLLVGGIIGRLVKQDSVSDKS